MWRSSSRSTMSPVRSGLRLQLADAGRSEGKKAAAADAAVAADSAEQSAGFEVADFVTFDRSCIRNLGQLCHELVAERADRPRLEAVGEKPRQMYAAGLPLLFWHALDAPARHWVKRRCGNYKPIKLMLKAIGFVMWNLFGDLHRLGILIDLDTLKAAVEESYLLPDHLLQSDAFRDRWDLLWVGAPGTEQHDQVVRVGADSP